MSSATATQTLTTLDTLEQFELPTVRAEHVPGPASRQAGAYGLPRATEFSDDRDLMNARWVVRQMKLFPELWGPLRAATKRAYVGEGRRGYEDGDWAHVFALFTMSDTAYLTSFWEDNQESSLWREAGFPVVPSFNTMETNFRLLETCAPVIEAAAYKLMRWAEQCDPRVNQDWHVDGTAYHSATRLEHCCPDPDACRAAGRRPAKYLPKLPDESIKERRHAVQRSEESKRRAEDEVEDVCDLAEGELPGFERDPRYHYQWLNVGGRRGGRHLFRSLDRTAATRAYTGGRSVKVWHGGIALASVDNYTGAMNGILFFRADEMEAEHYPALYEKVEAGIGHGARAMLADRGLHTKAVFEFNTRRGTGTIIPWREPSSGKRRRDMRCDEFDEHGVPRCKHCGGTATMSNVGGALAHRQTLGLYKSDNGNPRLRFVCALGRRTVAVSPRRASAARRSGGCCCPSG